MNERKTEDILVIGDIGTEIHDAIGRLLSRRGDGSIQAIVISFEEPKLPTMPLHDLIERTPDPIEHDHPKRKKVRGRSPWCNTDKKKKHWQR